MTRAGGLTLLPLVLGLAVQLARAAAPEIENRAGEPVLVLTAAMDQALHRFDPEFTIRRLIDYPPYLWRPACESVERDPGTYRPDPREAPFAVVGDFNGDGVLDVVMDGDNRKSGRRIVLLSNGKSFSASEVDALDRISEDIQSSHVNKAAARGCDDGIDVGLSSAKAGSYRSPFEAKALVLKVDGFVVSYFEKASVLFYLRDGKWRQYALSD